MEFTKNIKLKPIAKYVLLPGIAPRVKVLFGTGFGWLAMLAASIYSMVGLLPADHPYLMPSNKGRFGVYNVITEAARNLKLSWSHIDQVIVFVALLLGFVVLILQFFIVLFIALIKPALAAPPFASIFYTTDCAPAPGPIAGGCTDIAYSLLDMVFGIPGFFGSQYDPLITGAIPPYNLAMHQLIEFYNLAMLVVGVLIFVYYIVLMVGETAQTGSPFGRRFQHVWTPIRLVIALGLLVPLNYGLNSAQYITLGTARAGSSMATNGWNIFNAAVVDAPVPNMQGFQNNSLVAKPTPGPINDIVSFMSVVVTCKYAYEYAYGIGPPAVYDIEPFVLWKDPGNNAWQSAQVTATNTPNWAAIAGVGGLNGSQDIIIRFGNNDPGAHPFEKDNIGAECGEMMLVTSDVTLPGPITIQEEYWIAITQLFFGGALDAFGQRMAALYVTSAGIPPCTLPPIPVGDIDCEKPPTSQFGDDAILNLQAQIDAAMLLGRANQLGGLPYAVPLVLLQRGWGGAAIWYNQIAEWNGALLDSAYWIPQPSAVPQIMETFEQQRKQSDQLVDAKNRYRPYLSEGQQVVSNKRDTEMGTAMNQAYLYWQDTQAYISTPSKARGEAFSDAINMVLGVEGLITLRENKDVNPMVQLVSIGKGVMNATIRNLAFGLAFSTYGGVWEIIDQQFGKSLQSTSASIMSVATLGITIGFILYYVLPFLPFIYFFFAVGGWVKAIFEAMVGVPLWALAHLRIDGNGIPGDTASNGYFLIFEIFVRPILTVFGLLASVAIFSAMVAVLHDVFPLIAESASGFDNYNAGATANMALFEYKRSAIDELFYTIVYALIVYMIGSSSFKLIDLVPNNILRWMGAGVQSFGDQSGDPAQGLVQYAGFASANMAGQAIGALQGAAPGLGRGMGRLMGLGGGQAAAGNIAGNAANAARVANIK